MIKKKLSRVLLLTVGILIALVGLWFLLSEAEALFTAKDSEVKASGQSDDERVEEVSVQAPKELILNDEFYTYDHEFKTYLLIGTDGRGNMEGQGEDYEGDIADFLLLMALDETDGSYGFFQIDRDTLADMRVVLRDGTWNEKVKQQICLSYFYGGTPEESSENTVNAVSELLGGIPIDGYYAIKMDNIPKLNHAVGGVEVTIEHDFSQVDPSLAMGETILLSDEQAFTYVHDRFYVGDESNKERMERQTQYMAGYFDKVQRLMEEDPAFINTLFQELEENAVTNINGGQLGSIMGHMSDGEDLGILRAQGEHRMKVAAGDGEEYVAFDMDPASMIEIMRILYDLQETGE